MKPIKLTDTAVNEALERFKQMVANYKGDSDLTIKITPEALVASNAGVVKPIVYITTDAYLQMMLLVQQCSDELTWHGTVEKIENNYLIDRIYVYPQEVTGTTVDADETAYAKWLMQLPNDTINRLRFQGHSHVNMGVSPSGRDTNNWQNFLNLLKTDEFYLFCIVNKKGDFYWNIYDIAKNTIFENKDVTMKVVDAQGNCLSDWASENIEKYIKKFVRVTNHTLNGTNYQTASTMIDRLKQDDVQSKHYKLKPQSSESPNKHFVPKDLLALGVDYEPDVDMYYCDTYIHGFMYSNLWGCFVAEGELVRKKYGTPIKQKRGPGRPPKEKKNETSKGGKKK